MTEMNETKNMKKGNKIMKMNKKIKNVKGDDNPIVTAPSLDKLSGVVDLPDPVLNGNAFSQILHNLNDGELGWSKASSSAKYPLAVRIAYPEEKSFIHKNCPSLLLQITHPKSSKRQARFEYNPFHMTEAGEEHLDIAFTELFGVGFYEFLYHARFTRIDVFRSILFRDMEDYLVNAKWKKTSQCFFGQDGRLETVTFGKSTYNQIVIYDKAKQLHGSSSPHGTIRVECRNRINVKIGGLTKMKNPFKNIRIYSLACKNPPFGQAHWRAFQDSCRLRGINNALKKQPVKSRSQIKKVLSQYPVPWWDISDEDWDFLLVSALENAGLMNIPKTAPALNAFTLSNSTANVA